MIMVSVTNNDVISKCLVDARLSATPLPDFPGQVPETLKQAYAIQAASIARWPDKLAGWKVAGMSAVDRQRFSATRLAGPVFRSSVRRIESGSRETMPVYEGGFAAIEAEVVLELGCDVPHVERDFTDEELADLISAAYCGAEIASSPMAVVNQRGATSVIADLGNNKGVIVGPEIPGWRAKAPNLLSVEVTVDDQVVGSATLESIASAPLQALRFLVNHCARHDIMLPAGILVSSGALTGVHDVEIASVARIDYGKLGNFDVTFEPLLGGAASSVRPHGH